MPRWNLASGLCEQFCRRLFLIKTFPRFYSGFSTRFLQIVDALTYISQQTQIQSNEDLLRLYDRYVSTGSRLAEEQLRERGVLNAELNKVRNIKQ